MNGTRNSSPVSARIWICGDTLKHEGCGTIAQRTVNYVSMTSNPTNISNTSINITRPGGLDHSYYHLPVIKSVFVCHASKQQVSSLSVQHSFWFASAPRCVQQKQAVLTVQGLWWAIGTLIVLSAEQCGWISVTRTSLNHTSRSLFHSIFPPVFLSTNTFSIVLHCNSAVSAVFFKGITLPPRRL